VADFVVTASPSRFHVLYEDAVYVYLKDRFPFCDQGQHGLFELFAVPVGDYCPSLVNIGSGLCLQEKPALL
jgi:hypothetical protein